MLPNRLLTGVSMAILATSSLIACSTAQPPPNDPIAIDSQYGIPANSVPSNLLKPDGVMTNDLLPA